MTTPQTRAYQLIGDEWIEMQKTDDGRRTVFHLAQPVTLDKDGVLHIRYVNAPFPDSPETPIYVNFTPHLPDGANIHEASFVIPQAHPDEEE